MKSKDKTNKKKHESTIGKIIYGFLLFMPLLAIGVTCAYAIFNKNAYLSNSNTSVKQVIELNNNTELIENNSYMYNYNADDTQTSSSQLYKFSYISFNPTDYDFAVHNYTSFMTNGNYLYLYYDNYSDNSHREIKYIWGISLNSFNFTYTGVEGTPKQYFNGKSQIYLIEYNKAPLNDIFYYSIDKVQQSPLFNWAEDSAIYTGMTATCNALNITTTFIPLLMTYWLIISIIYFLYDIILIILHVFHRKIHELEESI